jgi:tyrosinase
MAVLATKKPGLCYGNLGRRAAQARLAALSFLKSSNCRFLQSREETMSISRRTVLAQGGTLALLAYGGFFGTEAAAQTTLPIRRSLGDLALNDPIIEAWRDGVRRMRGMTNSPVSWASLAAIHGTAGRGFNRCPHQNWYFLPWHRGYMLMYERIVRKLTGFQDFALPYWDWTRDRQLPQAFADQTWQGQPNPLYEASRDMTATDSLPDEVVGQTVIDQILASTAFEAFGTTRPNGQNSTDPSWIRRTGIEGVLEANPHDNVHGNVGGLMGGSGSAGDPIFMMHHCNIDRIWAVWRAGGNQDSTEPNWLNMRFQNHFTNPDGSAFSLAVNGVLEPAALGYSYGIEAPVVSSKTAVIAQAGSGVLTALLGGESPQVRRFRQANDAAGRSSAPLEVKVPVNKSLVSSATKRSPLPASEIADYSSLQANAAKGTRALLILRDIGVENYRYSLYRVFLNCDYLSQETPITDKHYAGTFGFFGLHEGHGDDRPSVALDITGTVKRVFGHLPEAPGDIKVQVLPVPRGKARLDAVGTIKPGAIEVVFISA